PSATTLLLVGSGAWRARAGRSQLSGFTLGDRLTALRLAAGTGTTGFRRDAELGATAVHRTQRVRVESADRVAAREELGRREQLHHRVGEQDDDDDVDDGRDTKREGEAAHRSDREHEEDDGRQQVDALRGEDGAQGALPTRFDGARESASITQFISDALE